MICKNKNMEKSFSLVTFILALACNLAFAQTEIKSRVDKDKVTTDETVTYKVTVESSESFIPQPAFPEFKDFAIISSLQSSQASWGKEGAKSSMEYVFVLLPKAIGKLKIGPATLKTKDKTYSSEELQVEVVQGKRMPDFSDDESLPKVTL
jgi:hypothetical protein